MYEADVATTTDIGTQAGEQVLFEVRVVDIANGRLVEVATNHASRSVHAEYAFTRPAALAGMLLCVVAKQAIDLGKCFQLLLTVIVHLAFMGVDP